jgi:PAS domain S-box-containing protein
MKDRDILANSLRQTPVATAIVAADNTVVSWDSWAERLTGYTFDEISGHPVVPLFDPAELLQHHLDLARAGIPTLSQPLRFSGAGRRQIPVDVQCSPLRHRYGSEELVMIGMREFGLLWGLAHRGTRGDQPPDLPGSLSSPIYDPLQTIDLHANRLKAALQPWTPTSDGQVEESLRAIKATVADLHRHLDHLRSHTNTLFHDIYDSLTAMCLHARLLEETLEQSTVGHPPEVERFLAAIKSAAVHLQALVHLGK